LAGVAPDGGLHGIDGRVIFRRVTVRGNLFAGVIDEKLARWAGDTKVPAYNYRLTLTTNPRNQVRLSKPNEYSREQYRLLEELFKRYPKFAVRELFTVLPIKNGKFDLNNGGPFSSNLIGGSWRYPEGSLQERIEIEKRHRAYLEGLLYFLSTDSAVPMHVRKEISNWGYARDEFVSTGNWPPMLYVRRGA
jgi:hypothetical protein